METHDREILRSLAARWAELAALPVMAERKRQWTALKDLRAERPMVLFETWTIEDYVAEAELECRSELARRAERRMREVIRQAQEIGDDYVVEPSFPIFWEISHDGYGVDLRAEHAVDSQGGDVAYQYNYPIRTPEDVAKLRPRTWTVDRALTQEHAEQAAAAFGDILPVVLKGTSGHWAALTQELFKLIGNDRLMLWTYDAPDALHRIMAYLRDDRIAYFRWMEREGLLGLNNGWDIVGSGSPGYTTALPQPDYDGHVRARDLWAWMESQETTVISPRMFKQFFLPYMADVSREFGLIYYGCCEPVHDRWDAIISAIPHVRAVSISPWCDMRLMAEKVGQNVVLSRKPKPWPISGETPDWDALAQDIDETLAAMGGCNLEIIYRDVYRIGGDRDRLRRWAELVRSRIN
jgi:hypothetical protein